MVRPLDSDIPSRAIIWHYCRDFQLTLSKEVTAAAFKMAQPPPYASRAAEGIYIHHTATVLYRPTMRAESDHDPKASNKL